MHDTLNELKKQNAIAIKEAIAKAYKEEQEYQQKIQKEQLDLISIFYINILITMQTKTLCIEESRCNNRYYMFIDGLIKCPLVLYYIF